MKVTEDKATATLTDVKNKIGDVFTLVDKLGEVVVTSYNKPKYKISVYEEVEAKQKVQKDAQEAPQAAAAAPTPPDPVPTTELDASPATITVSAPAPVPEPEPEPTPQKLPPVPPVPVEAPVTRHIPKEPTQAPIPPSQKPVEKHLSSKFEPELEPTPKPEPEIFTNKPSSGTTIPESIEEKTIEEIPATSIPNAPVPKNFDLPKKENQPDEPILAHTPYSELWNRDNPKEKEWVETVKNLG